MKTKPIYLFALTSSVLLHLFIHKKLKGRNLSKASFKPEIFVFRLLNIGFCCVVLQLFCLKMDHINKWLNKNKEKFFWRISLQRDIQLTLDDNTKTINGGSLYLSSNAPFNVTGGMLIDEYWDTFKKISKLRQSSLKYIYFYLSRLRAHKW